MDFLFALMMLLGMFVTGIGFWAIGQWLRSRGHGDKLDQIDAKLSKGQHKIGRTIGPLSGNFFSFVRSMNRIPLLGNKRSRDMWADLEEQERLRRKDGM